MSTIEQSQITKIYEENNLDISIALNYPRGMLKVLDSVKDMLIASGKLVSDEVDLDMSSARELSKAQNTSNVQTFHVVRSDDPKVWDVLKEPINQGRVKVVAVFHGKFPDNLPANMLKIDVGMSLRKKVTKPAKAGIINALREVGKYPRKVSPLEVYEGLLTLCYEVVYSPEYRVFPESVSSKVPLSVAFDFMFDPPTVLTDQAVTSVNHQFLDTVHG